MKVLFVCNVMRALVFVLPCFIFSTFSAAQKLETQGTPTTYLQQATVATDALQVWYTQSSGLYETTGWWNSANAITTLVDYSRVSGSNAYRPIFSNTLQRAQSEYSGFLNQYYDDEGWWALAWIDAYDLTKNPQYLTMARFIFTDMAGGWDAKTCGGGIWWSKDRKYKNAIANELFLSVASHLANRVKDHRQRATYLSWAQKEWRWFHQSGMINAQNMINDGLDASNPAACVNNEKTTWSYNQGVILAGLVELNKAHKDLTLSVMARRIADATLLHMTDSVGILHDPCEPKCGADGVQFKGIFVRNLVALNDVSPNPQYERFVETNADSIWNHSQGAGYQFGQVWSGPFDAGMAGSQSSALDAFVAAAKISKLLGETFRPQPVHRPAPNRSAIQQKLVRNP